MHIASVLTFEHVSELTGELVKTSAFKAVALEWAQELEFLTSSQVTADTAGRGTTHREALVRGFHFCCFK